ncbi:ABC transporter ATP-binding protein/permease [Pleionea sp. CnH1-48]|uniref:ABCB family ABC transporter ATP-binding protein/permease n=1 Tax=Pleionea sp. CnH1-48 TaxID=2954494 RepID=UPI0020971A87|nr:ABC transporter ATP-binding protein/permease [Pleionea sp. CnH1-48]MCO7225134.1 ABC transporter ATP-binding protein/permease [Pleionea sp. CnH1-48]
MRKGHFPDDADAQISWSTLKDLWPYLTEFKTRVFFAVICLLAAKLASVGLPYLLKFIVDDLDTINTLSTAAAIPLGLLLAYGIARFSSVIFGEIRDALFGRVTERAMRRLGLRVFQHLHALDLDFHLSRQTGGLSRDIERGTSGISFLLRFMVFNIVPTLLEVLLISAIFFVAFNIWFMLIVLIAVTLYVAFSVKATEWRTGYVREANEADSKSNTQAIDSLLNYETVKYFNNESFEASRYDKELKVWEQARRKNRLSLFVLNGGQALIIALALTSMMVLASNEVLKGNLTIGDFVMVNAYMMQLFLPLNFLGFVYREIKGSMANIERMFNLLKKHPKIVDRDDAKPLQVHQGIIEFQDVEFGYDEKRNILKGISFKVEPGQKLAVVGSSGAGKSTLVKLLFRFYDIQAGNIFIDGQAINGVTQSSLRQAIGIVPQDTVLFNTSIWNNIKYGNQDASDDDIREAIRLAHLEDFIQALPEGGETIVGERGLKLSGGEKQRVAIARTILKRPPILLFDEATSSLDSKSEQYIMQAINEVSKGHTSLVIAHRLSTVVDADQIVVLHEGEVAEQGTHGELLEKAGLYARLWELQQQDNG